MHQSNLTRREMVKLCGALAGASLTSFPLRAATLHGREANLTISGAKQCRVIPPDFCGLSYEAEQLADPAMFSAANRSLIGLVRRLGDSGILRIGGYTNELTIWNPEGHPVAPSGPPDPNRARIFIKPECILNLRAFLEATGWKLIYGLNLGTGSPTRAAEEAVFVARTIGSRLVGFQFGNEPDLFAGVHRPREAWDFNAFYQQWLEFAHEVRRRLPGVPLGGPDTAECCGRHWVLPFAQEAEDSVQFLSGHYYGESNPRDSANSIKRLFEADARLEEDLFLWMQASTVAKIPFRMTEGNSCNLGGKPGVSDAFCSALWGADYMLKLAFRGVAGVNFHGGGNGSFRTVETDEQSPIDQLSFHYSPIAGVPSTGFVARPLYYGMLLVSQLAGGDMLESRLTTGGLNLTAYGSSVGGRSKIVIINRELQEPATIRIHFEMPAEKAQVWRLSASALDSKHGVTLAGAEVTQEGAWEPSHSETYACPHGSLFLQLSAGSASLVTV